MIKLSDILKQLLLEKADRCKRIADRKYDKPSAYKSGAIVRCRKGNIWKDLKESNESSNLDTINELFETNSELSSVGTPEQYAKYLSTIFPNSKIKNIVYHGTNSKNIDKFKASLGAYGTGIYFQTNPGQYFAGTFGSNIIPALIDVKKPYPFYSDFKGTDGKLSKLWTDLREKHKKNNTLEDLADDFNNEIKKSGYDALIIQIADSSVTKNNEFYYLIFNPDNIHILGSKQDIERFKEFTNTLNEAETLRTWFKRKGTPGKEGGWVDCNTCRDGKCKACGRKKGEKRAKYPSCRPTPAQCKSPGKGKKWGKTK